MAPQKDKKQVLGKITRKNYHSGMGAAGITLGRHSPLWLWSREKAEIRGKVAHWRTIGPTGLDAHKNHYIIDFFNYVLMYNALTIIDRTQY